MSKKQVKFSDYLGYPEIYHDQAVYFLSKLEPARDENITVRLRARLGHVSSAVLNVKSEEVISEYPMTGIGSAYDKTGKYEFFEATFNVGAAGLTYCFAVTSQLDGKTYYYSQLSDHSPVGKRYMDARQVLDDPCYENRGWYILPGYRGPEWSRGMSWYSVMPDSFYNGDPTNDDMQSDENYDQPWNLHHLTLRDRYGGDLQGIMDKADYIKELGCDGVFYDPIQKAEQNAGYGSDDFDQIESTFGNADKYSEFIDYMHGKGLRLMQDVVVYFTTFEGMYINRSNRWPTPRLEESNDDGSLNKSSPYYSFFCDPDNGGHPMWNGFTLNHCDPKAQELLYGDRETSLIRYADKSQGFGVDGYRFDCGGWITGHDGTSDDYPWENEEQKKGRHIAGRTERVMPTIYDRIRAVNPEFNTLSEASGALQLRSGCWDSQWQIGVNKAFEKLLDPKVGNSCIEIYNNLFHGNLRCMPRSTCLCSKLQVNTHDESCNNLRPGAFNAWKTARLLQMTFIGSPSVYYGEEHNFGGRGFIDRAGNKRNGFSYFDWDESRWDYKMHNFFKAMLELRREYSAVRTGALVPFGHNETSINYARFDENGTVLTLTNQANETQTHTVDAAAATLADGSVLTDWLTGERFTVENGLLTLDVIPGGRILVFGGKATSNFRLGYYSAGDCSEDISDELEGTVTVNSAEGDRSYLLPAFGSFKLSAEINGNGYLTVKSSPEAESICYKAELASGTLTVTANGKLLTSTKFDGKLCLYRKADNTFGIEGVSGSEIKLAAADKVFTGFGAANGTACFTSPTVESYEDRALADDFNGVQTSMFNTEGLVTENGRIVLKGGDELTTRSTDNDWSFKARLDYTPSRAGELAAVISKQDSKSKFMAGRIFRDGGVYLFTGKTSCGELVLLNSQLDAHPNDEIIIQLQRIGTCYTAVYSYDGAHWSSLGEPCFMNLSLELPGIEARGDTAASVDYVSFGNALEDGVSFFTPRTPVLPERILPETERQNSYVLRFIERAWDKAPEGWRNTEVCDNQLGIVNKTYKDFRAEASFRLLDGNGWVGFTFGRSAFDSEVTSAYTLRLDGSGAVKLFRGEIELASATAPQAHMQTRLVLEVKSGTAHVYSGRKIKPILEAELKGMYEGFFSFATGNAAADVCNFNICADSALLYSPSIYGYRVENGCLLTTAAACASIFRRGLALTDYVLTAAVSLKPINGSAEAGLLLSSMYGVDSTQEDAGILLSVNSEGELRLTSRGKELAPAYKKECPDTPTRLTVIKQGKRYSIFVGRLKAPVFEYEEPVLTGSVIGFESHSSYTSFSNVAVHELQGGEEPLELDICRPLK